MTGCSSWLLWALSTVGSGSTSEIGTAFVSRSVRAQFRQRGGGAARASNLEPQGPRAYRYESKRSPKSKAEISQNHFFLKATTTRCTNRAVLGNRFRLAGHRYAQREEAKTATNSMTRTIALSFRNK